MMLDQKPVIVRGADSGIGLETAKILARARARVLTTARREETDTKVVEDICSEGGVAVGMVVDVTQQGDIMAIVDCTVSHKDQVIFHIHGGGYIFGPGEAGTGEAMLMAAYGAYRVLSIDYRMPPDAHILRRRMT